MLELVLVLCLDRIGGMPTRDITLFYPRSGDQTQRFRKLPDIVGGMVLRKLVYIVKENEGNITRKQTFYPDNTQYKHNYLSGQNNKS